MRNALRACSSPVVKTQVASVSEGMPSARMRGLIWPLVTSRPCWSRRVASTVVSYSFQFAVEMISNLAWRAPSLFFSTVADLTAMAASPSGWPAGSVQPAFAHTVVVLLIATETAVSPSWAAFRSRTICRVASSRLSRSAIGWRFSGVAGSMVTSPIELPSLPRNSLRHFLSSHTPGRMKANVASMTSDRSLPSLLEGMTAWMVPGAAPPASCSQLENS